MVIELYSRYLLSSHKPFKSWLRDQFLLSSNVAMVKSSHYVCMNYYKPYYKMSKKQKKLLRTNENETLALLFHSIKITHWKILQQLIDLTQQLDRWQIFDNILLSFGKSPFYLWPARFSCCTVLIYFKKQLTYNLLDKS